MKNNTEKVFLGNDMPAQRRGFSLIEVLVVTAIIMILVSILMPIIRSVRLSAHKTVCISNLKQLGMAMEMYSHDYRGFFPKEEDRAPYGNGYFWSHWAKKLEPYIDKIGKTQGYITNKIMKCPSNNDTYKNSWSYNSYAYNEALSIDNRTPRFLPYSQRPKIVVIVDGYAYFSIWSSTRVSYRHDTFRIDNFGITRRHGSTNGLFGDLSVLNLKDVPNEMRKWY
jgi:prepilin-type N-terminal cleavage/methylation domain-containing protein